MIQAPNMLRRSALPLALALALVGCGGDAPEKHVAAARAALAKNDAKAAIIDLKNALQKNADLAEARLLLGRALLQSGDARAAEVELRKARELGAPAEAVHVQLMQVYAATGQFKKVIDEAARVQPQAAEDVAAVQNSLAQALASTGDAAGAERALASALEKMPEHVPSLMTRARLLAATGKVDDAAAVLERILAVQPRNAEAWKFKGDLQAARDQRGEALASYRKAVEARPDYLLARFAAVSNLMGQGKADEATREFEAMRNVAKGHPLTLMAGTQTAFAAKDYKSAREYAQQLLRATPDNPIALTLAGAVEFNLKSYAQAETLLVKSLKLNDRALPTRRWLALTYLASGQPAKAVDTLKPVEERIGSDAAMLMLAGEAYLRSGDAARAEQYFTAAAKLDPKDARKQTRLALTRVARGEGEAGLDALERISAGDAGTSADMALIASHLRRGEIDKGMKAIDTLEKKQPDSPLPHEMRARLFIAKRDLAKARASFERALALSPGYFPAVAGLAALDVGDKKPAEAAKRFEALVATDPRNAQALLALAGLKAQGGGSNEEVSALVAKAIAARPDEVAPRLAMIDLYMRAKDFRKAITAGQEAIAALPDRAELFDALGQAQQAGGEYNQALASYAKMAGLQPGSPRPYMRMAEINVAAKKPEAAAQNLRQALEIRSDLVEAQRGLIMLDLQGNRGKNALALAREVQKQRPKEPIGHLLEGDIHAAQKSWGNAAGAYRAGLKLAPATELAIKLHGALLAGGSKAEADRLAETWQKDHPKDYGFVMHLGEVALARNELESASQRFRGLLAVMPENPVLLNNLAWTAGRLKAPDALPLAEKANKIAPNQPAFMDTWGMLLLDKGDTARALELLARAAELAPQAYAIRLNYARALIKGGKKREARVILEDLAALGDKFPARAEIEKVAQDL
ncbi:MAG: PEP-CTERM system TPR-repeat protein PrsT [Burkholderiales bacterium]|nr:PEP-CTERM system TPR-repeat protein PrsT [Burkholderiales bacterium]